MAGPVVLVRADLLAVLVAEAQARAPRIGQAIARAASDVLTGARSGRFYPVYEGGPLYQASAPGEPPAERTGALRGSWRPLVSSTPREGGGGVRIGAGAVSEGAPYVVKFDPLLPGYAPGRIAPRPFVLPVLATAAPQIRDIVAQPWLPRSLAA